MPYEPIENYGVIGDLQTVALVGMNGSIDFMCFPHFDSPSIFAALLDHKKGGCFQLAPILRGEHRKQIYFPDTNMLLTRFLSADGVAEVSDFMPIKAEGHAHHLVRRAKAVRGELSFRMICAPAFDYGRAGHKVEAKRGEVLFTSEAADRLALRLRTSVPVRIENGAVIAEFKLAAGETAAFVLENVENAAESHGAAADPDYVVAAFKETMNFWRGWVRKSSYKGRWREMVNRSALTLKLLTYAPTGALVAAPTFGLPEEIGGERNWDYRFTWIRDASFTVYGLMRLGYTEEAAAFMSWIEDRCHDCSSDGSLQIMYGLDGRRELIEETLLHWEGYAGSSPVRIGNGAAGQLQLDIYGELMDSVYIYNKFGQPISYDLWQSLVRVTDWLCANWQQPDEGIWEVRGGRREFLYSRLMAWVAVDRAVRLSLKRSFPAPLDRWLRVRDEIYTDIYRNFWSADLRSFVQYKGAQTVDASTLLMPLVKFTGPTDPRWLSTLGAIENSLVEDSLVYRYNIGDSASDGLSGKEGTFNMCSFWFVECLSRAGDLEKARFFFEKAIGYANHLGLYSEELGPSGEHLGNFPQAFTHLSLISTAYNLDRTLSGLK